MKFNNFVNITLSKLDEEIIKDLNFSSTKIPIFESPLYHETEFFEELNDIKTNHPFALERIEDSNFIEIVKVKNIEYKLYRKILDNYVWDFFISGNSGNELIYGFLKYKIENDKIILGGLWQIEWVIGLIRELITNYYSKYYSFLESGTVTNNKGKKFYQKLAREFIGKNKKVTVFVDNKEFLYNISDEDSYWKSSDNIFSYEKILKFEL